jgi:hypothetical protein
MAADQAVADATVIDMELTPQPDAARAVPVVQSGGAIAETSPAGIMMAAMSRGMSLADMREVLALQREWDADQARKAFADAMASFKTEAVRVIRNVTIKDGPLKGKKHADLYAITDACVEAMAKHGLSHTFKPLDTTQTWIKLACRIQHRLGYYQDTEFDGPVDTGPGRNAIQARKSSVTYLERITLLLALGLSESDADDDGREGGGDAQAPAGMVVEVVAGLIDALKKTKTDAEAVSVWDSGKRTLIAMGENGTEPYQEFKGAVVAHRNGLKAVKP